MWQLYENNVVRNINPATVRRKVYNPNPTENDKRVFRIFLYVYTSAIVVASSVITLVCAKRYK